MREDGQHMSQTSNVIELHEVSTGKSTSSTNLLNRLVGLIFSPKSTFKELLQKPSWLAPTIFSIILASASSLIPVIKNIDIIKAALLSKARQQAPPNTTNVQIEQAINPPLRIALVLAPIWGAMSSFFSIIFIALIFTSGLGLLLTPLIYYQVIYTNSSGEMLRTDTGDIIPNTFDKLLTDIIQRIVNLFKRVISVVSWSYLLTEIVYVVIAVTPIFFYGKARQIERYSNGTQNVFPLSVEALLPPGTPATVKILAAALNITTIWFLFLLSKGFSVLAEQQNKPDAKTDVLTIGVWGAYILLKIIIVGFFSLLGSIVDALRS